METVVTGNIIELAILPPFELQIISNEFGYYRLLSCTRVMDLLELTIMLTFVNILPMNKNNVIAGVIFLLSS